MARAECRVRGCPGRVEVIILPGGRTRDVCPCCVRRREWERADCPEVEGTHCLVCNGRLDPIDREDPQARASGRSRTRCVACGVVKNRVKVRRQYQADPERAKERMRRSRARRPAAAQEATA